MRSKLSRSASRRVSATASGCSAKRAAIAAGEASAEVELPRRRGSTRSSVSSSPIATRASCRWERARACAWTLPVATVGTPSRSASSASQRLRAAVAPPVGSLQLDPEAVAAEGGEQPPAEPLAQPPCPRARRPRRAPRPARIPTDRRAPPRAARPPPASSRRFGTPRRVLPRVRVRRCEQPAEVAVPALVLDQQREVGDSAVDGPKIRIVRFSAHHSGPEADGQLGAGDRAQAEALGGVGELHRAPDAVVVGQRQRRVAERRRGARQLERGRGAVEEGEGRVGVQLDVGGRRHRRPQARWRNQRPSPASRKTVSARPSASASSK